MVLILLVGALVRFWNLAGPDMTTDDATYSYRSIGYVDFMAATNLQSTPATWFPETVWWQKLSFHDAPPLVFLAQWTTFKIFGVNQFAARLPFALAGILAIYCLYLLGRQVGVEKMGLLAAGLTAIANYPVWLSRIGYLDGFLVPIIALSIYFFLRFKDNPNDPRNYIWWGVTCGLGLLTKYTFLFMLPLFLILIAHQLYYRNLTHKIHKKKLLAGIIACLIIVSPVIIYNLEMYRARGHFDAAISTMLGDKPDDFKGLSRTKEFDPTTVAKEFVLDKPFSLVILLLAIYGFIASISMIGWLVGGTLLAILELVVIGSLGWLGAILIPFMIILAALGIDRIWQKVSSSQFRKPALVPLVLGVILIILELSVTIDSQLAPAKLLRTPILATSYQASWQGFSELEKFVSNFYKENNAISNTLTYSEYPQLAEIQKKLFLESIEQEKWRPIGQKHLLILDERVDWFASFWIMERRRFYDRAPIHIASEFVEKTSGLAAFKFYNDLGFVDATAIVASDSLARSAGHSSSVAEFAKLMRSEVPLVAEIRDPQGKVAFEIYTFALTR